MARKRRKPGGQGPKRRRRSRPAPEGLPEMPDPRAVEGRMWGLVRETAEGMDAQGPAGRQAQQIMYQAFDARDPQQRVELARQALEIDPDCVDAYVLLAEHAPRRKESLVLYEKGVTAGARTLGPEFFQSQAGHFWGLLETRPYMRARLGLANSLWTAGRRNEAIQHLQDMLRLNPSDNQGVRYTLAGLLLKEDRDADLERLLQEFAEEGSATWVYTRALLAFRQDGDTSEARGLLKVARNSNRYVPDYLVGRKFPPLDPPSYYSPRTESEAIIYIQGFLSGWKNTPGAVAWLRANDPKAKKQKEPPRHAKGPLAMIKQWLQRHLPQEEDVWQADYRQLSNWMGRPGELIRPWAALVTSPSTDLVLAHDILEEEPSAALLWDTLAQAMQHPGAGEPHRPTQLQVRPNERWESLRPHLEEIGVDLVVSNELEQMDLVFQDLIENAVGKPQPGLLDVPGIGPEQAGRFYEAAAFYFQQAPWKRVGYEAAIKIECTRFQSGPWYAVIMGQSGLTIGLALYEDLDMLRQLWTDPGSDEENARQSVSTTVLYGEETDIPVADLEAAQRYGWPVARADAYPTAFHKERGLSIRSSLAWELELLEGCLRAIPEFVKRHQQDDPATEEMTVPAASGELRFVLSWVIDVAG